MKIEKTHILFIIFLIVLVFLPTPVHAFKLKTHIIIANEAVDAIEAPRGEIFGVPQYHQATINVPGIGDVPLKNAEVAWAVKTYPEYYRAGTLGPDAFPDLVGGQLWVHVNRGNEESKSDEECFSDPECVPSSRPHEQREIEAWRSIDYGMYLLKQANEWRDDPTTTSENERLQALAFAYGYLTHMIGDGFAHSLVNEWSEGVFSYFEGEGLYGPATEEFKHMAVEAYIDQHMPEIDNEDLTIEIPVDFLYFVYTKKIEDASGLTEPGAFGGVYFIELVKLRDTLRILSDSENWAKNTWGEDLALTGLRINERVYEVSTLGTQYGNPIKDTEDFFARRADMIDVLLKKWVVMSGCVAQNILLGSNVGPKEVFSGDEGVLEEDACTKYDFEDDPEIKSIFQGELNEAAWEESDDYGGVGANLKKQIGFITEVANRFLIPRVFDDIRSLRIIKEQLLYCENEGLLEWESCNDACTKANAVCTDFAIKAACIGCPTKDGRVDCGRVALNASAAELGRAAICAVDQRCSICAQEGGGLEAVTDLGCTVLAESAAPVCALCNENSVCKSFQAYETITNDIDEYVAKAVERVIEPLIEDAKDKLLEAYAGPFAQSYIDLLQEMENRKGTAGATWFMNLAFIQEDLQTDPEYLNLILQESLGVGGQLASNAGESFVAIEETYDNTEAVGRAVLQQIIELKSGVTYAQIWHGIIELLYRTARERNFNAIEDLQSSTYDWLDKFTFKNDSSRYQTRYAKFAALMRSLDGLSRIQGPSVKQLRASMHLSDDWEENVNLEEFHPVNNAIQLTKLGFLGEGGIHELGLMANLSNVDNDNRFGFYDRFFDLPNPLGPEGHQISQICRDYPHIVCDAIQSLDDPNHYGEEIAPETNFNTEVMDIDSDRSIASWESRNNVRSQANCNFGLTNFLLSSNDEVFEKLYLEIFRIPDYCSEEDIRNTPPQLRFSDPSLSDPVEAFLQPIEVNEGIPKTDLKLLVEDQEDGTNDLTVTLESAPSFIRIDQEGNLYTLEIAPNYDAAGPSGTLYSVVIRVTDSGGKFSEKMIDILVKNVNRPPEITFIDTSPVNENEESFRAVEASDPDGDPVRFTAVSIHPQVATDQEREPCLGTDFNFVTLAEQDNENRAASLRYQPPFNASSTPSRNFVVIIEVSDILPGYSGQELSAEKEEIIVVSNVNRPPEFELVESNSISIFEGSRFNQIIKVTDPDCQVVDMAISGSNNFASVQSPENENVQAFGESVYSISFFPDYKDKGVYKITTTATDPEGSFAEMEYDLIVLNRLMPLPTHIQISPYSGHNGILELNMDRWLPNIRVQLQIQTQDGWKNIVNENGDNAWNHDRIKQDEIILYAYGSNALGGTYRWIIHDTTETHNEGWATSNSFTIDQRNSYLLIHTSMPE